MSRQTGTAKRTEKKPIVQMRQERLKTQLSSSFYDDAIERVPATKQKKFWVLASSEQRMSKKP
jgi:hypothetical protein